MTEFFATVAGYPAQKLDVYVPQVGVWYVDAVLEDGEAALRGYVLVQIGTLRLRGTVVDASAGAFVLQRSLRIVGGAGGWGKLLPPLGYHTDDGVSPLEVARDAARDCGETLGAFEADLLPADFIRRMGPGSAVLERLAGSRQWWVDPDGVTHVGTRAESTPPDGSYSTLTYSPLQRTAWLACDDPAVLWIGSRLTDRMSAPQVVRDLEIHVDAGQMRVKAYVGGDASDGSRLGRALDAILAQRESKRLYGTYRYRVYSDPGDGSLNLQVVRPLAGLPDVIPALQSAGIAGALSSLRPGELVRVAFDEGDPCLPYVASYTQGDSAGVAPIARQADMTLWGGPGMTITLSPGPIDGGFLAPVMALGSPSGAVPVVMSGVPYLMKIGYAMTDPTQLIPPAVVEDPVTGTQPVEGYILTGSDRGFIE
jgi:hypothetical protein